MVVTCPCHCAAGVVSWVKRMTHVAKIRQPVALHSKREYTKAFSLSERLLPDS
jgi:hypothetical protein